MSETVNLTWSQLTPQVMTNLFLYGTRDTPVAYDDRIRPLGETAPTVVLDMASFMADGPGRYALACNASFVQNFFTPGAIQGMSGTYTVDELITQFGYNASDFYISFQHYAVDPWSSDYAQRTYILNTCGFTIATDTRFVFEEGNYRIENLHIRAFHDNFDFESKSWEASIGNSLLIPQIDPYGLGKKIEIHYVGGGEPVQATYDISDFNAERSRWESIYQPVSGALGLYDKMSDLIGDLKDSGTIQYNRGEQSIAYGSAGDDALDYIHSAAPQIIVGGSGSDRIDGGLAYDWLLAGTGNDTLDGWGGDDFLDGGEGEDTALFDGIIGTVRIVQVEPDDAIPDDPGISPSPSPVVQVNSEVEPDEAEIDTVRDIEVLKFGIGKQSILIDRSIDSTIFREIHGGGGNDLLIGGNGHLLLGGDDADHLLADSDNAVTLDGGAGNDYLEATGSGPVTYVFGRGSGHDVLGSLFTRPDPDTPEPYREGGGWLTQRQNDRIVFKDLMPDDLILEWDYEELIFDHEDYPDYICSRAGAAAIRIKGTEDTLYLEDLSTWQRKYIGELTQQWLYYAGSHVQKGAIIIDWVGGLTEVDLKIFEFRDGSVLSITDLFDFWAKDLTDIVRHEHPDEYSSAAREYADGSAPAELNAGALAATASMAGTGTIS